MQDTSLPGDPISTTDIRGKFAFMEARTVAEATSCLALNGIEFGKLMVNRPREYTPIPESMLPALRAHGVIGSTIAAPDGQDLFADVTTQSAAAPALMPPAANTAHAAIPSAPLALGSAAVVNGSSTAAAVPPVLTFAPAATGTLLSSAGMGGQPVAQVIQASTMTGSIAPELETSTGPAGATPTVALCNMMSAADLEDEEGMSDILEDTRLECKAYGRIVAIISPRPSAQPPAGAIITKQDIEQRVFVRFETAAAAVLCQAEMHGRQFEGRVVDAGFVSDQLFEAVRALPCFIDSSKETSSLRMIDSTLAPSSVSSNHDLAAAHRWQHHIVKSVSNEARRVQCSPKTVHRDAGCMLHKTGFIMLVLIHGFMVMRDAEGVYCTQYGQAQGAGYRVPSRTRV
eukprot:CAMPEP_0181207042 /NCGR_PEP_ID=MMETSP1096-20121128/21364_1 /TAXON_ID=156174 ORGANISM="Chrysochromulina ericina, Strain CCMP281" /NCGR_SAMPLE_ID=MMETSP1096 /ASSEMBLY_ACC=CAM_ASM_000453 /LENGTH=400 /DNA_ID=CAMNT_0023297995 /DNA_START=1 /DNA_END=1205 /DNA_ORIENTATION=+